MAAQIEYDSKHNCVLRMTGLLRRSEFVARQKSLAARTDAGNRPRILAILENFAGWERGAGWKDLDFLLSHSRQIAKIAIVGERRWEVPALAFGGAEVRRAPVKFFTPDELTQARTWLRE